MRLHDIGLGLRRCRGRDLWELWLTLPVMDGLLSPIYHVALILVHLKIWPVLGQNKLHSSFQVYTVTGICSRRT